MSEIEPRVGLHALLIVALLTALLPSGAAALPAPAPARPRVLAYYVPYDPTSWASLAANPDAIDALGVQWVTIDACGNLGSRDDQTLNQFARAHGIGLFPSLLTGSRGLNHALLADDDTAAHAIDQIVAYTIAEGYDGFDLDLEGIAPEDRAAYSAFVAAVAAALHQQGKTLALALPAKSRDVTTGWAGAYDYAALGGSADLVTIMTYDDHGSWGEPGPVAPFDWVEAVIAFATSQIPADKVLIGLASYGYDWNVTSGGARSLSYSQAAALADRYQVPIVLDPATQSATFGYQAPAGDPAPTRAQPPPLQHQITERLAPPCPVPGPPPAPPPAPTPSPPAGELQDHVVWLEESASAAARLGLVDRYHTGGVADWRLGLEDPRLWSVLRRQ